jgi:hypothetical protein
MALASAVPLAAPGPAHAQEPPADLTAPPVAASGYVPAKTAWGDPDFRGTWPLQDIFDAAIPLQRPATASARVWQTPEEFAARLERARKSDAAYADGVEAKGTAGLAQWLQSTSFGHRTSLLVSPADGRLPPLMPGIQALLEAGRTSWNKGQPIDWVTDLDTYDRCISRGFPASMLPFGSNNGMRVFQSPGFVAIELEAFGTRIIPLGGRAAWPSPVRAWLGLSRGHWEGDTLVIETANIRPGDGATNVASRRAAPPVRGFDKGTMPVGPAARTVERLTMTGPDTIAYEATYTDPDVFTAPWTVELEWTRDDGYRLYEYACHEGNRQIRDLITASRAARKAGSKPG